MGGDEPGAPEDRGLEPRHVSGNVEGVDMCGHCGARLFWLSWPRNGSNSLDFSEFLRLMRMHREQELLRTFHKREVVSDKC